MNGNGMEITDGQGSLTALLRITFGPQVATREQSLILMRSIVNFIALSELRFFLLYKSFKPLFSISLSRNFLRFMFPDPPWNRSPEFSQFYCKPNA